MASLEEKKVFEEIQKRRFRSIYYCYGPDAFKLEFFIETLKKSLFAGAENAFNLELYYGDEIQSSQLLDSMREYSLFGGRKLILVKNADRIPARQQEPLLGLLREGEQANILVFLAEKTDGRTKWIQQIGKAGEHAVLIHFQALAPWESLQWVRRFAKAEGKDIEESTARLLTDWLDGSLADIKHAVEKAALFSSGQIEITEESVRAVSIRVRPESVFEFTSALLQQNRAAALSKLHELLEQGEEPLALLGLAARQYRWLIAILALKAEGQSELEIQSELRLIPKAAKELFLAAKRLGARGVIGGLQELAYADMRLKSSREPANFVLSNLTLSLVSR